MHRCTVRSSRFANTIPKSSCHLIAMSCIDLKHAAMRYGTFFITGKDVEAALRLAPYDQTLDFFHQPLTYKQQWRSVQPGILNGFHMSGGFSFGKGKEGKQDGTSDLRQFYVAPPSHPLPLGMTVGWCVLHLLMYCVVMRPSPSPATTGIHTSDSATCVSQPFLCHCNGGILQRNQTVTHACNGCTGTLYTSGGG